MAWMVIRVRGGIHARHDILETLAALHIHRQNHATIVPETPSFRGMLQKVQGYVTWGEAERSTVERLLHERGVRSLGSPLLGTEETPEASLSNVGELADAVMARGLLGVPGVRPLFRLKAPKGGWNSTKKPFALGGALGYRGGAINGLALRMV